MILLVESSFRLAKVLKVRELRNKRLSEFENLFLSKGLKTLPVHACFSYTFMCNLHGNKTVYVWTIFEEDVVSVSAH